jgi:hypothetical protein
VPNSLPVLWWDLVGWSRRSVVLVDHAAEESSSPDRRGEWDDDRRVILGWVLCQALVRAMRLT